MRGWGEVTAGYSWFINNGVDKIVEKIKERKSTLDPTVPGDYEKEVYLDALRVTAEGIVTLAERYAIEADRLASVEKDPKRKRT